MAHHAGYVAICGRTNVGKSTLLNQLLGEKLAIVSKKPQTTRTRISAVKNIPGAQLVFLDSPGLHLGHTPLDRFMLEQAKRVLFESNVILLMVDARNTVESEWKFLGSYTDGVEAPIILVINKIDLLPSPDLLLPLIENYTRLKEFNCVIPISALNADGVDLVLKQAASQLPESPPLFPSNVVTQMPEEILAAEIVREKIYQNLFQEIPYSVAVVVEQFQEKHDRRILAIEAVIYVERESQKAIVIGKKGVMLKEIGTKARLELEAFFGIKVYLKLWVRVEKNWSKRVKALQKLGFYR